MPLVSNPGSTAPHQADAAGVLVPSSDAASFSLTYRRSRSASGVSGVVLWKNDLRSATPWSDTGVLDISVGGTAEYDLRRATVALAPSDTAKYLLLRVNLP
jgi:hypothetical protein